MLRMGGVGGMDAAHGGVDAAGAILSQAVSTRVRYAAGRGVVVA